MPLAIGHGPSLGPVIEDSSVRARRFQGLNAPGFGHGPQPGPVIEDSSYRARRFQGLNAPGYWPLPRPGPGGSGFFRPGPQVPGAECPWLIATAPDWGR